MTNGDPVPEKLIDIVDGGDQHGHIRRCSRGGGDVELAAIPGVAGVAGVALRPPGSGGRELLPAVVSGRVINPGSGPRGVIAQMELPGTVKRRNAFAETFDGERDRKGGARRRWQSGRPDLWAGGEDRRDCNQRKQSTLPVSLLNRANFQRVLKVLLPARSFPQR
jgi:hypothetical protein